VRRNLAVTAVLVLLFWAIAALLVIAAHVLIEPISAKGAVAAKVLAIFVAAFAFIRVAAPSTTIDQAMLIGVAWLLLDIAVHLVSTRYFGWRWIAWIGVPGASIPHDLFLLSWVVAPTVFARRAQ
jgi:hypothetical protein